MTLRQQLAAFDAPIKYGLYLATRRVSSDLKEDALQEARIGYLEAEAKFDASRGASLPTFAQRRMKGRVADFLQSEDSLTRHQRQAVKSGTELPVIRISAEVLDWMPSPNPSPERQAIAAEALEFIPLARGMSRKVIEKLYLEDKRTGEAAADLDLMPSNTCHHKNNGLRQIQRALGLAA